MTQVAGAGQGASARRTPFAWVKSADGHPRPGQPVHRDARPQASARGRNPDSRCVGFPRRGELEVRLSAWSEAAGAIGAREVWRLPILRELWSALLAAAKGRRRSAEHERVFYQLLGYCLRPGFGYPLDEWRGEETAKLFPERVEFHKETPVWKEFWICWRRISGGLSETRQGEIWSYLAPYLAARVPFSAPKNLARPKGIHPEGLDEMVRLAAALEHLDPSQKLRLGEWIADRLRHKEKAGGPWTWALGRLASRTPIYGSIHKVLPPDAIKDWAEVLLTPEVCKLEGALFALTQITRMTGDRARDVEDALRNRVCAALKKAGWNVQFPSWMKIR